MSITSASRRRVGRRCSRRAPVTAIAAVALLAMFGATPSAYQMFGVRLSGRTVTLKWARMPVRYHVTDRAAGTVSASVLQQAVSRAFATWQGVATSAAAAEFVGYTAASPFEDDGMVTLGFLSRPDLDRVLGATDFLIDKVTGEIVETDIFFNSTFAWSVASAGESGRYDLESIALHEIGHLFGLGHSALGETELRASGGRRVIASESVMFPIAFSAGNISGRVPKADDVAGISVLYPDGGFSNATGSISGRVTLNGDGVYGAHVVAFNPATGKLVGGFTVDGEGRFAIGGLDPGLHVVRVEPIDDADLDSFFDDVASVDVGFTVTYFERYVSVPRGGDSGSIEIAAKPASGTVTPPISSGVVVDPTTIEFVVSADHDGRTSTGAPMVEAYHLEIYRRDDPSPIVVVDLGRITPFSGDVVQLSLSGVVPGWPLPSGIYEARVTAVGPTGIGRSEPSNAFSSGKVIDQQPPGDRRKIGGLERPLSMAGSSATHGVRLSTLTWPRVWPRAGAPRVAAMQVKPAGGGTRKPPVAPRPIGPSGRWPGRPRSFEVTASALWTGGSSLGTAVAGLTPNDSSGSAVPLFRTTSTIDPSIGLETRLGYRLTRGLAAEVGFSWSRPAVGLSVFDDYEGAPDFTGVGERLDQFVVDGGVSWHLAGLAAMGGRLRPFVSGGAGYVWQVHETRTLVETATSWRAGAGADYRLRARPLGPAVGMSLRVEGGVRGTIGGVTVTRDNRVSGAFGAGLLLHF